MAIDKDAEGDLPQNNPKPVIPAEVKPKPIFQPSNELIIKGQQELDAIEKAAMLEHIRKQRAKGD